MRSFKFKTDKAGRAIALEWNDGAMRWVRTNLEQALFLVSSGAKNVEVCN